MMFWWKTTILSKRPAINNSSSILISILYLIGLIAWSNSDRKKKKKRGRTYVYSPTVILRCFIVRIWLRLDSNRALYQYLAMDLPYNRKVMKACGLSQLPPSRRTFDRRLNTISEDIKIYDYCYGRAFYTWENSWSIYILSTETVLL